MYYELILAAVFLGLGLYLTIGTLRTKGAAEIKDKNWTGGRILFLVCAVLSVISITSGGVDIWSLIRLAATLFCVVAFLLSRDGIGQQGVVMSGRIYPWQQIKAYDYQLMNGKFYVYFIAANGDKADKEIAIPFDGKDQERVTAFLKKTAGRKYRRMKKEER